MEKYLNSLYFGNGIYGIKRASYEIFGKKLSELNISECATIAGIIKAPLYYSPLNNIDKATMRRNIVLKEMLEDKNITTYEYNKAINSKIIINNTIIHSKLHDKYVKQVIIEASKILGVSTSEVVNGGYNIATYYDANVQKAINNTIDGLNDNILNYNHTIIVSDNKTCGIQGLSSSDNINIFDDKRQVGSIIKPIAVYLPALEEGIITPSAKYNDSKKSFEDYIPHNYNDYYRGLISIREAVKYSSNVIPVELIDILGVDKSKHYLSKLGINLDDNGLSIALGGLSSGISFNDLSSAYTTIANGGYYGTNTCIKHIADSNGNVKYRHNDSKNMVFNASSCYLMQNMLVATAKNGTAKKLAILPYQVASKTGTVAHPTDKNSNIDAYNMSFTSNKTVLSWIGGNLPETIQGGGLPTIMARNVYNELYDDYPHDFAIPDSVKLLSFDKKSYDKDESIILSNANNTYSDYFDIRYLPQDSLPMPDNIIITYKDDKLTIKNARLADIEINKYDIFGNKSKIKEMFNISNHEELMLAKSIFHSYTLDIYYDGNLLKSVKII